MRRFIMCATILLLVPGSRDHAVAAPPPRPIVVELCDLAHLGRAVSEVALGELHRMFWRIGVEVKVVPCGPRPDRFGLDPLRVAVVVLRPNGSGPARIPAAALGAASTSAEGAPIVWIFSGRIERAAHRAAVDRAIVLGHVMAHEIAHVLIPEARHAPSGLMREAWRSVELVDAVHGQLRFADEEASEIRRRLRTPSASSLSIASAETAIE